MMMRRMVVLGKREKIAMKGVAAEMAMRHMRAMTQRYAHITTFSKSPSSKNLFG